MEFEIKNRKNFKRKISFWHWVSHNFFFIYEGKIEYIKFKILILQKIL